jgi:hypothetical protein
MRESQKIEKNDGILSEYYSVEHQYAPGQWTTDASCISTYEDAEKHSVMGCSDFRIVRIVKYRT